MLRRGFDPLQSALFSGDFRGALSEAGRADLLARVLALTRDPSPEVQLQAVLTFGEAREASQDVALAQAVRALPNNKFARDAFYSGLADRELPLIERLLAGHLEQETSCLATGGSGLFVNK